MIHKLPRWIVVGAFFLAFSAGYLNVAALSGLHGYSVSHATGVVSSLAIAIASTDWSTTVAMLLHLGAFVAGAIISGLVVGSEHLAFGRRYGVALVIQSGMILIAWLMLRNGFSDGRLLLAMACGLQNAMVSTYSGATIRTTHLTGVLSDIGSLLGNLLAGRPVSPRHMLLLGLIVGGFLAGGLGAVYMFGLTGWESLLLPFGLSLSFGLSYLVYRVVTKRSAATK